VQDQINAAKHWASKRYVDSRRIGIWGWVRGHSLYPLFPLTCVQSHTGDL
jgi:hypothetical protein